MADYVKQVMTKDGPKPIDYQSLANLPTIDATVIAGSTNAIQGGAVYNALEGKLDAYDGKAASAQDSDKLGGQLPSYYATTQSVETLKGNLEGSVSDSISELETSKAPVNHAVDDEIYGIGNDSKYGHLKLSDSIDSTSGINDGSAATPDAVAKAYQLANKAMPQTGGDFTGAVTYTTLSGGNITSNDTIIGETLTANINIISNGNITASGDITGAKVYGAVWNDYAEFRNATEEIELGRIVCENGDDTISLATERLQPGALATSDTYGFAIGKTEDCQCPIAVAGRVLVFPYEDRNSYAPGDPVCAAPGGTVSKMTREEVVMYPDRIVGTVSAIPTYDTWSSDEIQVKNRIWIKI